MANAARGEVDVEIGGQRVTLALNLGALAELEDAFQVESFEDALKAVAGAGVVSAKKLHLFMDAVIRGNGLEVDAKSMSPSQVMETALLLFRRSGLIPNPQAPASEAPDGDGPLGAKSAGKPGKGSASATSGSRRPRSGR